MVLIPLKSKVGSRGMKALPMSSNRQPPSLFPTNAWGVFMKFARE